MAKAFVSSERLDASINTVIQYLRDAGYDGAVEDGTSLADIVLKPNAMLYSLFSQLVSRSEAYMSIARAEALKPTMTQDEYDAAIDCVLANWFVSRNQGKPTYGTVRVTLLAQPAFKVVKDGERVAEFDNVILVADGTQTFSASQENIHATENVSLGQSTDACFVDIAVRSQAVTDKVISAGDVLEDGTGWAGVDTVVAAADFVPGLGIEKSEDFIRRTKVAITTRELITDRAIKTVLKDRYPEILGLYVAGHGCDEQLRDIIRFEAGATLPYNGANVSVSDVEVHYGNKADIYVATALTRYRSETGIVVRDGGRFSLSGVFDESTPFAHFLSAVEHVHYTDGHSVDTPLHCACDLKEELYGAAGYPPEIVISEYVPPEEARVKSIVLTPATTLADVEEALVVTYSGDDYTADTIVTPIVAEVLKLDLSTAADGTVTASFTHAVDEYKVTTEWLGSPVIATMSEYVRSDEQRVMCYDPLVKNKFPVVLAFDLTVKPELNTDADELAADVKDAVVSYCLEQHDCTVWCISELVAALHKIPGVALVRMPVTAQASITNPESGLQATAEVVNKIVLSDFGLVSKQISMNTIQAYTDRDLIQVTIEEA